MHRLVLSPEPTRRSVPQTDHTPSMFVHSSSTFLLSHTAVRKIITNIFLSIYISIHHFICVFSYICFTYPFLFLNLFILLSQSRISPLLPPFVSLHSPNMFLPFSSPLLYSLPPFHYLFLHAISPLSF